MIELNSVFIAGNLCADPDVRQLQNSGTCVCKLRLASNHKYTANGQTREETTYLDVEAWAKLAETCGQFLRKGRFVVVEGRLKLDTWQDPQTGQQRDKLIVVAQKVHFGPDAERQGAGAPQGGYQPPQGGYAPQPQGGYAQQPQHGYQPPPQQPHGYQPSPQGGYAQPPAAPAGGYQY